ncbi:transmembrane protein 272-like [Euwallacea fornicatus]|uniref:transmembrane protein 272-like n=1 Tax=Euwallacea fornicatus TaxID=995702 RepID=UPI00338F1F50
MSETATKTTVDVEKLDETKSNNNNHFFDEKVKVRAPPGINGSLVVLYALFFTAFTIGCININKCPLNRLIPIYLIVAGGLGGLTKFLYKYHENNFVLWIVTLLVTVDLVWHGLGSYVVYKEYQPSYNSSHPYYCNRTVYLAAFWTLTIEYTLLAMFILLSCCYMIMRRDFRTESGTK